MLGRWVVAYHMSAWSFSVWGLRAESLTADDDADDDDDDDADDDDNATAAGPAPPPY